MKYLSAIITQASGKLGGAVAAKNRGGNYLRAKVAPVQPRTVAQQEQRANLANLAGAWKALTAAEIAGWNSLASTLVLHDPLGNAYVPTGEQIYVGNNRNLSQVNETVVSTPPTVKPDFADPTPLTLLSVVATPALHLETALSAAPTGNVFYVRATPMISPGKSFIGRSLYRGIGYFPASGYASMNILAGYVAKFGNLVAGAQIAAELTLVSIATGFAGTRANVAYILV
jgi:hypothetical protein